MSFPIFSKSISPKHVLSDELCLNYQRSLHLKWESVDHAAAYAVLIMDKDATGVIGHPFVHWMAFILDPTITELEENASQELPSDLLLQFENNTTKKVTKTLIPEQFQTNEANCYFGPMPPDKDHLYEVKVFALKKLPEIDPNKLLILPYFEKVLINAQPFNVGTLTFIGKQVEKKEQKIYLVSNSVSNPDLITGGFFYHPNLKDHQPQKITNIKIENLINGVLSSKHYTKAEFDSENKFNKYQSFSFPQISFDAVEHAKSYVILLNNSQAFSTLGVPIVNWNVYGLVSNDHKTVTLNSQSHFQTANNSYGQLELKFGKSLLVEYFEKHVHNTQLQKAFLTASQNYGSNYFVEWNDYYSNNGGYFTFFIYATDLAPEEYGDLKNQQQILQKINNHVLAEGTVKFKIHKI